MEKDAGLDFYATISVEEARKKLNTNFLIENIKEEENKPTGFISKLIKKVFKHNE